jgi:hypothetical protein
MVMKKSGLMAILVALVIAPGTVCAETRLVLLGPAQKEGTGAPRAVVAFGVTVGKNLMVHPRYGFDLSRTPRMIPALSDPSPVVPFVATAGNRFCYVLTRRGKGSRLARFEPFGDRQEPVVIHLEDLAPAALRELHSTLFIGEKGKVLAWDVSKKDARPEVIYQTEKRWKPKKNTDAFALCGGLLVAVDNVMSPKYAFVFRVSEEGPEFLYTGNLPFGVNSQYFEAAGADGKLAILKRFGHRGGSGESVEFFTVTEEGIREVRAFGEFYPREGRGAASEARQLVPGDRSSFHGLEFDGNRLLLGAGKRGLIIIPHDSKIKPSNVDLGGNCTDLVKRGPGLFALVQTADKTTRLVVLKKKEGKWVVETGHDLANRAFRFAD